jgi:formylglycine-generating enzyme required for sulfatase activity
MVAALAVGAAGMHVLQERWRTSEAARIAAEAQTKAEREQREAEDRRQAAAAAKRKTEEETAAKARLADAKRQQDEREAAEKRAAAKKAAEEQARQQAEAKRKADLAEQQRRDLEAKMSATSAATLPLDRVLTNAEELQLAPRQEFQECKDCPRMIVVPAGTFLMGTGPTELGRSESEGPQHSVTIARAFAAGKFEVTFDQFRAFVKDANHAVPQACSDFDPAKNAPIGNIGSFWFPGFMQQGDHPAVCVSWKDAKAYVEWLSMRLARDYRLLSEAEWEYAARAGSQTRYHFGEDEKRLCEFGNVADIAEPSKLGARPLVDCRDGYLRTAPVGKYAPNAFGLHDTIGNVWEWVEDCGGGDYAGAPSNGSASKVGACATRVSRGGGWGSVALNVRSATRNLRFGPDERYHFLGFRVARTLAHGGVPTQGELPKQSAAEVEQRQRMANTAFVGDIIATESGRRSSLECRNACQAKAECKGYEFRLSASLCYLYRRIDRQHDSSDAISGRWD